MKGRLFLVCVLVVALLIVPAANGSIRLIPSIDNPQDAVDVAVPIPEAGVRLAMIGFDQSAGTAQFALVQGGNVTDFPVLDNVRVGEELNLISDCFIAVTGTTADSITIAVSCERPYLVLVANSIDYGLSMEFVGYLEGLGVEVIRASAVDFEGFQDADTIVILGGPDALDGIGNITRQVLNDTEEGFLRTEGNKGMLVHENPWNPGYERTVTVLAGSDRYGTRSAAVENKERFTV